MSQWGPSSKGLTESQGAGTAEDAVPAPSHDSHGESNHVQFDRPSRFAGWTLCVPFFLSAFFYLSAFLAIFSPLPLLLIGFRKGKKWAWLASASNGVLVALVSGGFRFFCFFVFVITLTLTLIELIQRRKSLEKTVAITLLVMAVFGMGFLLGYSQIHHLDPVLQLKNQISEFVDYLSQSVSPSSTLINPDEAGEWKKSLLVEFPSAVAIFALILVWANLTLLLKFNPNGILEKLGLDSTFLKKWKAPEFLVWPTLLFGAFLIADFGLISDVALNGFKFLMAIYAIQGLSILSHFFDLWGVRGMFRWVGFSLSIFLMMPLVLSLGFFDLWFDFRGKFRQS